MILTREYILIFLRIQTRNSIAGWFFTNMSKGVTVGFQFAYFYKISIFYVAFAPKVNGNVE